MTTADAGMLTATTDALDRIQRAIEAAETEAAVLAAVRAWRDAELHGRDANDELLQLRDAADRDRTHRRGTTWASWT